MRPRIVTGLEAAMESKERSGVGPMDRRLLTRTGPKVANSLGEMARILRSPLAGDPRRAVLSQTCRFAYTKNGTA